MEPKAIENLINKYFEGETSLQEEIQLKEYFRTGKIAAQFQEYVPIFGYFESAVKEQFPEEIKLPRERKKVFGWVAVAASIVILAGIFLQKPEEGSALGSYENPELALEKTKQTLQMVSQLMNSGKEDLLYIKEFNNTKNSFLK